MKKFISCIASLAMLASLAVAPVHAGTSLDTYGIAADLSGTKLIKWDGKQYSDAPTLMNNYAIINLGDKLGVFSHPTNSYYQTYSNVVRACLMGRTLINGSNVSPTGYTITSNDGQAIISPEKQIMTATKDGVANVIPIVDTYELSYLDYFNAGNYAAVESGVTATKDAPGFGGKGFDDKCVKLDVAPGTTTASKTRIQVDNIKTLNTPKTTLTASFDVYVSGDVDGAVYADSGVDLIQFNHDGTVTYPVFGGDVTNVNWTTTTKTYAPNTWHRVALTYDYAGARLMTYIDGDTLSVNGWYIGSKLNELGSLRLGIKNGTYAEGGTVAYDNVKLSRGYNVNRNNTVSLTTSDDTVYSIDSNVINVVYGASVDAVKTSLAANTDASKIQVYSDSTKTALASTIDSNSVVTMYAGDKVSTYDYTIAQSEPTVEQKIGLVVANTYPYQYRTVIDSSTGEPKTVEPTLKTNYYVEKLIDDDDNVTLAVYSNTNQVEYKAYGWRVLETLSSTTGYTLSIWDSTKTIERSVPNIVVDGKMQGNRDIDEVKAGDFLKAEKDGDVEWIPIVDKTNVVVKTDLVDKGGSATDGDVSSWGLTSTATGIGLKANDDTSVKIASTVTSGNVQIGANQSKASLAGYVDYTADSNPGTYTWALNIYPTTGASFEYVTIYNTGGAQNKFLKYADGKVTVNLPNGTAKEMDFAANRWHRVAISTDTNRSVCQLWVDGTNLLSAGSVYTTNILATRFNLLSDNAGDIYFDDLTLYKGYYDTSEEANPDYVYELEDYGEIQKDTTRVGLFYQVMVNKVEGSLTLGTLGEEFTITDLGAFDVATTLTYAILGARAASAEITTDITLNSGENVYIAR